MRIKRVRFRNGYKRFFDLTIDLGDSPARIVALVGPNGCGKSSVLDGLLYHQQSHERIGGTEARDHRYHSMTEDPNITHGDVVVDFVEGKYSAVRSARSTEGKANTIFSFRSPYRYNSFLNVSQSQAVPQIRLNKDGASDASSLDDKMEANYRRIYVSLQSYIRQQEVTWKAAKAHVVGELNESIQRCLNLEISDLGDIESSRGTIYFRKPDHPKEFSFNVLSSGEKEVVDLLLDLYLRRIDFDDSVFLIDEPELHINTSIQSALLREMNKLVGLKCQIWLTTHSIGMMRALQTDLKNETQIVRFHSDESYGSEAITLRPIRSNVGVWRELFSIALDDLAELVCPKTLIYCEGRAEPAREGGEKGIDAKVFNLIFGPSHPNVLFVSSGGNT